MEFTITNNNQQHSMNVCHNTNFEKAKYLFSLFNDNNNKNTDDLIFDFAMLNNDFTIYFYIANVFETNADVFMLSIIFNKINVFNKLLETNKQKLDKLYIFGTGMYITPRDLLTNGLPKLM